MTREEAIAVLRREIEPSVYEDEKSIAEAIDMAIEALSEVRCNDCKWNDDVVEVVRCKNCRFRKKVGTSYYCDLDEFNVQDADFCSWGERKEP